MFNVFCGILIYFVCIKTLNKKFIPLAIKAVSIVCLLNLVLLSMQLFGYDPIYTIRGTIKTTDCMGTFGLKATMGIYFALAIPLLASSRIWFPALLFIPVGLSVSTGAMLGGLAGYLFCLWHKARKAFFIMLVLLTACICFVIFKFDAPMGMFGTRPPMWGKVLHDCFISPITGYGLDSFRFGKIRYYKEADTDVTHLAVKTKAPDGREAYAIQETIQEGKKFDWWDNPHNEYLQLFFEFGIVGVLIVGFILYGVIERFRKSYKSDYAISIMGFFVVLLISSFVQFPFHLARIGHLIPVMLALFMIETEKPQLLR